MKFIVQNTQYLRFSSKILLRNYTKPLAFSRIYWYNVKGNVEYCVYRALIHEKKGVMIVSAEKTAPYYYKGLDCRAYLEMGCHAVGSGQYRFRVWAPNARSVSVVGDFNGWDPRRDPMTRRDDGVWETVAGGLEEYSAYKFWVCTQDGTELMKADPFATHSETRPGTASKIFSLDSYQWGDQEWIDAKNKRSIYDCPVNIYEVHAGSWPTPTLKCCPSRNILMTAPGAIRSRAIMRRPLATARLISLCVLWTVAIRRASA